MTDPREAVARAVLEVLRNPPQRTSGQRAGKTWGLAAAITDAAIAAYEAAAWRPISEAPKDGTPVLVWNGRITWKSSRRIDEHASGSHPEFGPGNGHDWYMEGETDPPTHFRYITPPETSDER